MLSIKNLKKERKKERKKESYYSIENVIDIWIESLNTVFSCELHLHLKKSSKFLSSFIK